MPGEEVRLPSDIDYSAITGLSKEIQHKLGLSRPETLSQASRIPGVTPAAISLLLINLKKTWRSPATGAKCVNCAVTGLHADELRRGAEELGIELNPVQETQLLAYLALLIKWNKAYNLTAVRDPDEMVSRHLLDSLSVVPHVAEAGQHWLDVGSGGGMPGIPLAIMFADAQFTLLDSNGKKPDSLQVKLELKLDNLEVIHSRGRIFQARPPF